MPPIKKVFGRVRLDEKAQPSMNPAAVYGTMNAIAIPRHPQIPVCIMHAPNVVIAHTVVFWQNQLDRMTLGLKLSAQSVNDVPQSSCFNNRRTFRSDLNNVHKVLSVLAKRCFGQKLKHCSGCGKLDLSVLN